jgi:hypothetical protein
LTDVLEISTTQQAIDLPDGNRNFLPGKGSSHIPGLYSIKKEPPLTCRGGRYCSEHGN